MDSVERRLVDFIETLKEVSEQISKIRDGRTEACYISLEDWIIHVSRETVKASSIFLEQGDDYYYEEVISTSDFLILLSAWTAFISMPSSLSYTKIVEF